MVKLTTKLSLDIRWGGFLLPYLALYASNAFDRMKSER